MKSWDECSTCDGDPVAQVNRLHAEVAHHCEQSEEQLPKALVAAWRAGKILTELKVSIRKSAGHGSWEPWLKHNFDGSVRTAQRYMALAKNVTDVADFRGMSLRQTYMALGFSVEKKGLHDPVLVPALPTHLRLANRFIAAIPSPKDLARFPQQERDKWRHDLRPVWDRLKLLFELS